MQKTVKTKQLKKRVIQKQPKICLIFGGFNNKRKYFEKRKLDYFNNLQMLVLPFYIYTLEVEMINKGQNLYRF